MKKYLVTNAEGTKGVVIEANEAHEAKEKGRYEFYSPFYYSVKNNGDYILLPTNRFQRFSQKCQSVGMLSPPKMI